MVAAATTSLPERAEAGRNYDYRYVWIRDQCYAGQAVAAAGPHPLLDDAGALRRGPPPRRRGGTWLPPTRPPAARYPTSASSNWPATPEETTSSATGSTDSSNSTRSAKRSCYSPTPPIWSGSTLTIGPRLKPQPGRRPPLAQTRRRHLGNRTTAPGHTAGSPQPAVCAPPPRSTSATNRADEWLPAWRTRSWPRPRGAPRRPNGHWQRSPEDPGLDAPC